MVLLMFDMMSDEEAQVMSSVKQVTAFRPARRAISWASASASFSHAQKISQLYATDQSKI